eukprot:CAMPEP_0177209420 /NCGR_PEP_ID=MMETSP0367-20130122/31009_1 /TAXON_ID=447022 ORGANISM="Scrippsiella hangoei-like, Strain SHHI-4" /NCGR_SAMPLE_ID=MMETSP0367 /ASSEMBLY_ACC=CAM_ASM_000362 /LENGTH=46 /DNA_ID= /DNA_START= /DNA_END= /DNA_ORIENTATION=
MHRLWPAGARKPHGWRWWPAGSADYINNFQHRLQHHDDHDEHFNDN